jgi:predicted NBD/HSP70 family sugar kinase
VVGREARIGLNEAVFREVNERIDEIAETFDVNREPLDLVCECGNAACVERISMTRADYEQLRADPNHFAVHPGHEEPDVDTVVARAKGYDIVQKNEGAPAEIARRTAPRREP